MPLALKIFIIIILCFTYILFEILQTITSIVSVVLVITVTGAEYLH